MNTSVAWKFSAESFKNEEYELYGGILQKTAGSQWAGIFWITWNFTEDSIKWTPELIEAPMIEGRLILIILIYSASK